jgi:NEDD8-activating enzyme E1 regulatory subunit
MIGASATATSVLKNLVLPGIGSFTILDSRDVTPADAGNNFFLEGAKSIGKKRAVEAVRLLQELNDGVQGKADLRDVEKLLATQDGQQWLRSFTLVIAVNTAGNIVKRLSQCLWEAGEDAPTLMVVTSAGLIAEFYIQFHEHHSMCIHIYVSLWLITSAVIESHSESAPSLRIDKPYPALLAHAMSLDFA